MAKSRIDTIKKRCKALPKWIRIYLRIGFVIAVINLINSLINYQFSIMENIVNFFSTMLFFPLLITLMLIGITLGMFGIPILILSLIGIVYYLFR